MSIISLKAHGISWHEDGEPFGGTSTPGDPLGAEVLAKANATLRNRESRTPAEAMGSCGLYCYWCTVGSGKMQQGLNIQKKWSNGTGLKILKVDIAENILKLQMKSANNSCWRPASHGEYRLQATPFWPFDLRLSTLK